MNLMELFESKLFQDVGTFNSVFKTTPIVGFDDSLEVQIGELLPADERLITVGDTQIKLCLTQRKSSVRKREIVETLCEEKVCIGFCGKMLPISMFHRNTSFKTGLESTCKACKKIARGDRMRETYKKWRAANPEKIKEHNKKYRENKLTREIK